MAALLDMAGLRDLLADGLAEAQALAEDEGASLAPGRLHSVARIVRCGDPHDGFVWLRCAPCGTDRIVALSCKSGALCPRCGGRRMATTAAHLVDDVLPEERLRQWVVTFPQPLPRLLAWQPELLSRVLAALATTLQAHLRGVTGRADGQAGVVAVVQTFTGDLRRYVHVHALVPEGVWVEEDGEVVFVRARVPRREDIQAVAVALAARLQRTCRRWVAGLALDGEPAAEELLDALARLGEEPVGEGPRGKSERPHARQRRWLGAHLGVEVHAGVATERGDKEGRERLARYVTRPALSLGRLTREEDGRVTVHFKTPWRSGRVAVRLAPGVFALRLASLALPRGVNAVRYFGAFAPAAPLRARVVPPRAAPVPAKRSRWVPWRTLIFRVFGRQPDLCPVCGEPMTEVATLRHPDRAWEVLRWIRRHGSLARDGPEASAA